MDTTPEQGHSLGDQQGRLTMPFQQQDTENTTRVVTTITGDRAFIGLTPPSPGPIPDEAINAVHDAVVEALTRNPRSVVLDLTTSPGADSRLVALTCEVMRLCRRQRARLVIRCTPELRAWMVVYHIPGLRRVLEVRHTPRPADASLQPASDASAPAAA